MTDMLAKKIADRLAASKCSNIKIYDVEKLTPLADTYLVVTCRSESQIEGALAATVRILKDSDHPIKNIEYKSRSLWCLIDCGELIIHLFAPGERERMRFDELFRDCPTVEIEGEETPPVALEEDEDFAEKIHEIDNWR